MSRLDIGGLNSYQPPGVIAHGQSAYQVTLAGTRAEGVTQNGSYYYTDFNMMEEVSVETAGMGAEVGAAGAMVNIIPKSGGNEFKGSAYITATGEDLASNNVEGDEELQQLGVSEPPLPLRMYDYNIDGGGRIQRDKVWWYSSWRDFNYFQRIVGFPREHQAQTDELHRQAERPGDAQQQTLGHVRVQRQEGTIPRRRLYGRPRSRRTCTISPSMSAA